MFEWYTPVKKMVEPLDKDSTIIKPHSLRESRQSGELNSSASHLNKYEKYDVTGKVTEGISLKNSSVFSSAGKGSLSDSLSRDLT